ncbi:MAG: ABC transporter permease subunit [Chloroflexi bacterium]|nr:ABC transporter permease subunit [Chloroflexota bacterium]
MRAEFKHSLRRARGQIIGWGLGLFLYGGLMAIFFSSVADIGAEMNALLENYPPEMLAFFPSMDDFTSPVGYLSIEYFSFIPIILGIFAVTAGARLLVSDEEKGILDLLMAHPISRSSMFWGRFSAFAVSIMAILLSAWLGLVLPSQSSGMELTAIELLRPFLPLFALLLFFGSLALLLSMLLPAGRAAGAFAGGLLVANFLLFGLSNLNEDLVRLYEISPFYFHQGGPAIDGLEWDSLAILLAASGLFTVLALIRFRRRDLRVGGEGGWQFSLGDFLKRRKALAEAGAD